MKNLDILINANRAARKNTFTGGILSILLTIVVILVLGREYMNF